MAPAAKRRKTDDVKYTCFSCMTDRTSRQFPDINPTSECEHLINTCSVCLKQWIAAQLARGKFTNIGCPQCDKIMTNDDVRLATTKRDYQRYDERERRHIQDSTPDWRWCLNPNCRAGQVHESKVVSPQPPPPTPKKRGRKKAKADVEEEKQVDVTDICTCQECGLQACVTCDRPWHEGETCTEYQFRVKDRVGEEDKSLKAIGKSTKKCPNCCKSIEKNGGCPSMVCSQCDVNFCWNCVSVFDRAVGFMCKCTRR